MREMTSLGAAIAAGFASGVWSSFDELANLNKAGRRVFEPVVSETESHRMYGRWQKAVEMSRGWLEAQDVDES